MAEISKCSDIHCPSKEYCYRFTAPSGMWQNYHNFNREDDADNCLMFWSNQKCIYCGLENEVHKISCPTNKIQIYL